MWLGSIKCLTLNANADIEIVKKSAFATTLLKFSLYLICCPFTYFDPEIWMTCAQSSEKRGNDKWCKRDVAANDHGSCKCAFAPGRCGLQEIGAMHDCTRVFEQFPTDIGESDAAGSLTDQQADLQVLFKFAESFR